MRFGVCTGAENARALKAAGFDYLEINVQRDLKPEQDESVFAVELERIRRAEVPAESANLFLPGDLKLCGPEPDTARALRVAETVLARAERVGLSVVVFGSGRARAIPEGYERTSAWAQLVAFARAVGPIAGRHGVTIAMEPLRRPESNVLNAVTEGAEFVREVDHPAIRLLADAYHWAFERESPETIVAAGPLLCHTHIATAANRMAPGLESNDFAPFFDALRRAGYDGRVSVEGKFNDLAADAAGVLQTLKNAAAAV